MAVNIGPKIGIDGEAQFRKEINGIIQQSKTLASEMKAVTSAFDANDKSQEALTAQTKVLTKQIETQQQRVSKLTEGLNAAAKQFGENDTRTQKWQQAVNEATADLNRMKSQLTSLENAVDDVGESMKNAEEKTTSFGDILKAGALIEGAKAIAGAISGIIENTKEYRKIMANLETSSQLTGYTADQTAEIFKKLYGVLGDDQTAATTTSNLQAIGLSQEQLLQITNATIGAWAKYGDSIPIDGLSEAINETIKVGTVTGTFADVLNWAGQSEDEFNEKLAAAGTEAERANIVIQAMADQGLAKAGEAWQKNNEDIVAANQAQADFNAAMAEFGKTIAPATTAVAQAMAEVAQAAVDIAQGIVQVVEEGNPLVAVLVGAAVAAGALALALNFSAIVQSVTATLSALKVAILGINAAMMANPIVLIISLIAGLIAAIAYLWATNEDFRKWVIDTAKQVVELFLSLKEKIDGVVKGIADAIVVFFTQTIPNAFESFKKKAIEVALSVVQTFVNLKAKIDGTIKGVADTIVGGIGKAVDFITSLPGKAVQWGKDFIQGMIDGIMSKVDGIVGAVSNIASTITSWLHFSRPDVGPLRQYESWMPDMMRGMAKGIRENSWRLEQAMNAATSNLQANVNINGMTAAGGGMNMGGVSITINPAPGMDVNALADAVAYKLQAMTQRKAATW